MLIVLALGGNALLQRGEPQEEENLVNNIKRAVKAIANLAKDHTLILCHGNGPQVGLLSLQADAYHEVKPYGLDVLCAESQGMIGYLLQRELNSELKDKTVVTLITQVIVDHNDPAFKQPSKPIGPFYSKEEANQYQQEKNWQFIEEKNGFRRIVPSPMPFEIVELPLIKLLVENRCLVICGGGGGISVFKNVNNQLVGIESIIDKDLTAAEIAIALKADKFVILTDIDGVYKNWEQKNAQVIRNITSDELEQMQFAAGSMEPKIKAATKFVQDTNKKVMIGALIDAEKVLREEAGTTIVKG